MMLPAFQPLQCGFPSGSTFTVERGNRGDRSGSIRKFSFLGSGCLARQFAPPFLEGPKGIGRKREARGRSTRFRFFVTEHGLCGQHADPEPLFGRGRHFAITFGNSRHALHGHTRAGSVGASHQLKMGEREFAPEHPAHQCRDLSGSKLGIDFKELASSKLKASLGLGQKLPRQSRVRA